jgi:tetratricopeptide (TPR) repeat protein
VKTTLLKSSLVVFLAFGTLAIAQLRAGATSDSRNPAIALDRGDKTGLGAISETDQRIAALQNQVKEAPGDFARYDRLGSAYFQKARETGDVAYYELAEKALDKAVALIPNNDSNVDPLVDLALVYMGEHRFTEALLSAQKAIASGSGNLTALAVEGDAYTDLGEYEQAAAAYEALRSLGTQISSPLYVAYITDSRTSYLSFLNGDTPKSVSQLKDATVAALQLNIPRENLAWLYYEWGQRYFLAGDLQRAEMAYRSALTADPEHYRSLAGLAQVRASEGRFDDAIKLYKSSLAVLPFPQYIAELGDIYLKTGRATEAQQQYDLVEYIGYLSKLNRVLNNRELALFYADRNIKLDQAVQLARNELDVRHDVYTWDTLAWALYRDHQLRASKEAMEKARHLHTNDPLILFHAGEVERALGDDAAAERDLTKALQINPTFHIFYAQQAAETLHEISLNRQRSPANAKP